MSKLLRALILLLLTADSLRLTQSLSLQPDCSDTLPRRRGLAPLTQRESSRPRSAADGRQRTSLNQQAFGSATQRQRHYSTGGWFSRRNAITGTCAAFSLTFLSPLPTLASTNDIMSFPLVHPGLRMGNTSSGVTCEVFVDFTCPYSRIMVQTLFPLMADFTDKMVFIFHNVLQPWHHQSLWLHESSFAVKLLYPNHELAYWEALFADAPNWYDKEIYGLTRAEFYAKIAAFAADIVVKEEGGDVKEIEGKILQYLIPPMQAGGNFPEEAKKLGAGPKDDENAVFALTRQIVKFQRKRGVHVTPTVFFNGIEQSSISSRWTAKEWKKFLNEALR
jgi:hypothetical protein